MCNLAFSITRCTDSPMGSISNWLAYQRANEVELSDRLERTVPQSPCNHIGRGGERNIPYKSVKTSPQQTRFKTLRGIPLRENPKRTIIASGGLKRLQMVSKSDTGRCAREDVGPPRGWIVRSHIDWRGEQNIPYKCVETSPQKTRSKTLKGSPLRESPKRTISTRGGLRLLQMVSEPDIGWCAREDVGHLRGWIVRFHVN